MTAITMSAKQNKVLRNTFATLALTMITTVVGAVIGVQCADWMNAHPILNLVVTLVLAIGLMIGVFVNKDSGVGLAFLFPFTAVMGYSLGSILNYALELKNGPELIALAFLGTAASLTAMSFIAMTSKRDFSNLGAVLFGCLLAIIVLELVNTFFIHAPMMMALISMFGAIVFSLYILYDVNQIVMGHEDNYIIATLSIYLDVINLFVDLLRLLLIFAGESDD